MGKGEPGGRQGFVSLSVGNQVSGPVGRPLSISVLLAVQLAVPRVARYLALSLSVSLFLPAAAIRVSLLPRDVHATLSAVRAVSVLFVNIAVHTYVLVAPWFLSRASWLLVEGGKEGVVEGGKYRREVVNVAEV